MAPDDATSPASKDHAPHPSLAAAPWLRARETQAVLDALAAHGHQARIVGGAVRNALLGLPATDIDIATPAQPDDVIAAAEAAGLATVATGLAHGTVTVIANRRGFEVTTLRRDEATDGRHATVAFTHVWEDDARRRDFTINALYCDGAGRLYDPVGGREDLDNRRVRFIGSPDARIGEDYLRILRFFRFFATYAIGPPDKDAMSACARGIGGMARLSSERVRAELVKLLVAPRATAAVDAMTDIGLLAGILGMAPRPGVLGLVDAAEADAGTGGDAMLRLSALALAVEDDRGRLAERLRLSNDERRQLVVIDNALLDSLARMDVPGARRRVYRDGAEAAGRAASALAALRPHHRANADQLREIAVTWPRPRLPVGGRDLLAAGLAAGPEIGRVLAALEAWWIAEDFPDADSVRAQMQTLIGGRGSTEGS